MAKATLDTRERVIEQVVTDEVIVLELTRPEAEVLLEITLRIGGPWFKPDAPRNAMDSIGIALGNLGVVRSRDTQGTRVNPDKPAIYFTDDPESSAGD